MSDYIILRNSVIFNLNNHLTSVYRGIVPVHNPGPGTHITDAIKEVFNSGERRILNFNGHMIFIDPLVETKESALELYLAITAHTSHLFTNSALAKLEEEKKIQELKTIQRNVDNFLDSLAKPAVFIDDYKILLWLREFFKLTDNKDIKVDWKSLYKALQSCGFERNESTDLPLSSYKELSVFTEWVAGQAMDYIYKNKPNHHFLIFSIEKFLEEYKKGRVG